METSELREQLKYSPLFVQLKDAELDLILKVARKEEYSTGETIVNEGSPGNALYFIVEGAVQIIKKGDRDTIRLSDLKQNDCFGEMSLIDIEPRSASVVAVQGTTVLGFNAEDLASVFQENINVLPLLVTNIARILSRRLRDADQRIVESRQGAG